MNTPAASPLGHSGLKVPRLWLGAMMFGGPTDESVAREIVATTRDAGLFAIDTADTYTDGESEHIVGRLIAADRSRWVLATKVANPVGDLPNDRGLSRRWLLTEIDNSLKRLGTDWIDLWYMHRDDETTPIEEVVSTMGRLIEAGKIRYYGVSNFRAWRIARMVEVARRMGVPPPIACQPPYSAVTRQIEVEVLPVCDHYGVGVVAYSPLARGVLTGKYSPDAKPEPGSRAARGDRRILQTEFRVESMEIAQKIKAHAEGRGMSASQFAIAWALNNRLIHGVIGGPRTLEQWNDYLAALPLVIDQADEAFVDSLVSPGSASTHGYHDPQYPVVGRRSRT
ncbi:aldo/keto reductase [soil metagenome]